MAVPVLPRPEEPPPPEESASADGADGSVDEAGGSVARVVTYDDAGEFDVALAPLVEPALARLARRLRAVPGWGSAAEREIVLRAARGSLYGAVRPKANRLLLLELHAARMTGRLTRATSPQRWDEFVELAAEPRFWADLDTHYPAFAPRLDRVVRNRCAAVVEFARRLAADRPRLRVLFDAEPGALTEVSLDAGDSHRAGRTVALVRFEGGRVVYKPRSLAVDDALVATLDVLLAGTPVEGRIRVPRVVRGAGYGWAEHVTHRHCAHDAEQARFYRGLGEWMAVAQLLGGTDLHADNVIACGPVAWVVDCETLFSPEPRMGPSGLGDAFDRAAASVRNTVLRTGLLPMRLSQLALQGVDMSAVGALPGQQPRVPVPVIAGAGTDLAHLAMEPADIPGSANLPAPDPDPMAYREEMVRGYRALRRHLDGLDRAGRLRPALEVFAGCALRAVLRPTQVYVEIARMLWHPASLHDEGPAVERARDVLTRQAVALRGAPSAAEVVAAEVAELLDGDVPFFTMLPEHGVLAGPRGTTWGEPGHLIDQSVQRWRASSPGFDEEVIRASLLGVYRDRSAMPASERRHAVVPRVADLDARRRALAGALARDLCGRAVAGDDGTRTWIGPVYTESGFNVRPFAADLYGGQAGVALALQTCLAESRAGFVPPVEGLAAVADGAVRALVAMEDGVPAGRLGAFDGVGSTLRTWLALYRLSGERADLARALRHAERAAGLLAADTMLDVTAGAAGLIVPLLGLARTTGDAAWLDLAHAAARHLADRAVVEPGVANEHAYWPTQLFPQGIGGFAHGATGIGWALARLGHAAGEQRWLDLAEAAFAFQESLYRPEAGNWLDRREADQVLYLDSWCHGGTGVGLAAWDLYVRTGGSAHLDRAVRAAAGTWRTGFGWDYTLCHGDLGSWEVVDAVAAGAPEALGAALGESSGGSPGGSSGDALGGAPSADRLDALVLTGLEEYGPLSAAVAHTTTASLMSGSSGALHQLLRMRRSGPAIAPSLLLLDGL